MKKNIKVLHVIVSLGNGGAERQLIEILKYNRNHGVLLLSTADIYKEKLDKLKIKYWEMEVKNKLLIFFKILFFRKVIMSYKPDIVQSWMYNACLFSVFCKLINLYDKPLIWNIRCSNMVTEHYSLSLKFIIYACVFLSKYVEKIIYNSYAGQAYHKKIGFSQNSGKVIYNGVDSKKFNSTIIQRKVLRKKYNLTKNDLVFMCVARVDPMKNYNNFLKAYKSIGSACNNKIKLVLAGKGTDKLDLPNNCIALGMIKNIEEYYNIADIVIVPSAFGEGFSNVLVEGMLTNLYPVATDVGDAKKIIGSTGFILNCADEETLKKELSKIIHIKKIDIRTMGLKARNRAHKLFTIEKMISAYNNIFLEVKS
ncbi:MAG: hypothetical protein CMM90_00600 [Rickettsiales bacterium]|nr:hypothetical protein [Rickettsiales bacterium]